MKLSKMYRKEEEEGLVDPLEQYLAEIDVPLLTHEEVKELTDRREKGDKSARNKLVVHNLRLVVSEAKKFQNRGLSLEDLIGEGNLGLIRAAELYHYKHGTKFSTYAVWWIDQSIRNSLKGAGNTSKQVRIPAYMVELINKARNIANSYAEKGVIITFEQAVKRLFINTVKSTGVILAEKTQAASIVRCSSEEEDNSDIDIRDDGELDPLEEAIDREARKIVEEELRRLPPQESEVIKRVFGVGPYRSQSVAHISRSLDMSKDKVNRYKSEGVRKLRDSLSSRVAGIST